MGRNERLGKESWEARADTKAGGEKSPLESGKEGTKNSMEIKSEGNYIKTVRMKDYAMSQNASQDQCSSTSALLTCGWIIPV